MTTDPKRLLDSATAGDFERLLLERGCVAGPTDAQREEIWRSLGLRLTPNNVGSRSGGHTALGSGALAKVAVILLAAATGTVAVTRRHGEPPPHDPAPAGPVFVVPFPSANVPVVPAATSAGSDVASPMPAELTPLRRTRPPASRPPGTRPSRHAEDALLAESMATLRAREALLSGDCPGALERLNAARTRYPSGALAQEREALAVEALSCAGRATESAERAAAFLHDYPDSPHVAIVRRFAR